MHELKSKIDYVLEKALIVLETIIGIFSVLVLTGLLVDEIYHLLAHPEAFTNGEVTVSTYLHHMLDIVIGLEFVKLLMHLTPANILEVLTMAMSRGIIVNHGTAVENFLSIACIIALFAAKRYLIPRGELNKEMDESSPDTHHHHRGHRKNKHKEHKEDEAVHH